MPDAAEAESSRYADVTCGPLKSFRLHYNDVGEGEVVLLIHGSGPGASSWANFNANVDAIATAGFRVILLDLPGWGKSDPIVVDHGPRSAVNAAAIVGLLDVLKIDTAHLIGNSMGGIAALEVALTHPARVDKLVSMGGGVGGNLVTPMPTEGIKRLNELYLQPTQDNLDKMLEIFVYRPANITPELRAARFDNIVRHPRHIENFARTMKVNPLHQAAPHIAARLHEITAPTLVVWGSGDQFVSLEAGLRLLAIPDSRLHIFNRCGHWVQWEHSEAFNRLVVDFLRH